MPLNLPTNLLRSFVAIVDTGSMISASEQVFVTQSALSLQVKRLEDMVQQSLFLREGRRLALTPAGETLLGYARRLLALNDETVSAVGSGHFAGPIRIGMVQDFAETMLGGILARFADLHPDSQLYARVAGTAELLALMEGGQLDIVVGYAGADDPGAIHVAPMAWYGHEALTAQPVVPLAVLEKPCRFREAAIAAFEAAGQRWRITIETPNLSTLRAAVEAGLGVTARTRLFLGDVEALAGTSLPALPQVACIVRKSGLFDGAAQRLFELAVQVVRGVDGRQDGEVR